MRTDARARRGVCCRLHAHSRHPSTVRRRPCITHAHAKHTHSCITHAHIHRRSELIARAQEWIQEDEDTRHHEAPNLTVEQAAFLRPGDIIFDNFCDEVPCSNTFVFRVSGRHLWARARRKAFPLVCALLWHRQVPKSRLICALSPVLARGPCS